MKIVSSQQMQHLEAQAFRDGASQSDFMEEAGSGIALVVHDYIESKNLDHAICLMCGKGNNAGDAYVAGIHLLHLDYDVIAYQLWPIDDCSTLCRANYQRFLEEGGRVMQIGSADELIVPAKGLLVDGILGTGFSGTITEPYASIIWHMNNSGLPIIAIDIPSGLNGTTGKAQDNEMSIIATETAFLGLPKTGFFLQDGWNSVGKLRYVDFGLPKPYIDESEADLQMLTKEIVIPLLPEMSRNRHKYEAGYIIGIAGSPGMPGAAILAASAALKSGAGIVKMLHPKGMEVELSSSPPELIKVPYDENGVEEIAEFVNKASSIYIGPGLGREPATFAFLRQLLPLVKTACVIDADALDFLASPEGRLLSLPAQTILTPHRGEMQRLLGSAAKAPPITLDYLKQCQAFAAHKMATIVLKGGPTFIFHPDEPIYVCGRGDPGMATAGSGDVFTGLIAGLLGQKIAPLHAAMLGSYIHGLAGEYAAAEITPYCMTAGDILYHFPEGFMFQEF